MSAMNQRARRERLAGLLTVATMLLALALVNSPLEDLYRLVHHTPVSVQVGEFRIAGLAAVGGMVVPAAIYLAFNIGTATAGGWAIPTATDIVLAWPCCHCCSVEFPPP